MSANHITEETVILYLAFTLKLTNACQSDDWSGDLIKEDLPELLGAQHYGRLTAEYAEIVRVLINAETSNCECRSVEWTNRPGFPYPLRAKAIVTSKKNCATFDVGAMPTQVAADHIDLVERVISCAKKIEYFVHNTCKVTTLRLDGVNGALHVAPHVEWACGKEDIEPQ